jgi:hypothetical protein
MNNLLSKSLIRKSTSTLLRICFFSAVILYSIELNAQWVTTADSSNQLSPEGVNIDACSDNNGGCYVCFTNFDYIKTRYYLQKINAFGLREWSLPVMIGDTADLNVRGVITPVNNFKFKGVIVCYFANSAKETIQFKILYKGELFLQKIDNDGKLIWGINGVRASIDTVNQDGFELPTVIPDDSGGVFVMWVDKRHSGTDVRGSLNVQRISSDGKRLWGEYGIQLVDTLGKENPIMIKTIDGVVISYVYKLENKLTKLDYQSNSLWTTLLTSENGKRYTTLTSDKYGNIYLGGHKYVEQSLLLLTLVLRKISTTGSNAWADEVIIADSLGTSARLYEINRLENTNSNIYATWKPQGNSKIQIYDSTGKALLMSEQMFISTNSTSNAFQHIIQSDSSSLIAVLADRRSGDQLSYSQKISHSGEKLWTLNDVLLTKYTTQNHPIIIRKALSDTKGGVLVIGSIEPHWGIYGIQVNKYGVLGSVITKAINVDTSIPNNFVLYQNYPNPFNPSTTIIYSIPERSIVRLSIFNTLGQKISEMVNETKDAGSYEQSFNASQLSSGIYFYRIEATSVNNSKIFVETKKMVLLR